MFYDLQEIIPEGIQGDFFFGPDDQPLARFTSNEVAVRALIEGQALAKRLHAQKIGFSADSGKYDSFYFSVAHLFRIISSDCCFVL